MWLLAQLHLYHHVLPSFRYSAPINFLSLVLSTISALSIPQAVHSTCTCYNITLRIQRSIPFDPVDPSDLFVTFMGIALFNLIIIFTCSLYVSSITIFIIMRGKEPQGPFITPQLKLKIRGFLTLLIKIEISSYLHNMQYNS